MKFRGNKVAKMREGEDGFLNSSYCVWIHSTVWSGGATLRESQISPFLLQQVHDKHRTSSENRETGDGDIGGGGSASVSSSGADSLTSPPPPDAAATCGTIQFNMAAAEGSSQQQPQTQQPTQTQPPQPQQQPPQQQQFFIANQNFQQQLLQQQVSHRYFENHAWVLSWWMAISGYRFDI